VQDTNGESAGTHRHRFGLRGAAIRSAVGARPATDAFSAPPQALIGISSPVEDICFD
jgi:hypothetical protein